MERLLWIYLILFPFCINAQTTAERGLFIYDNWARKTTWLNENGEVVKVFAKEYSPKFNDGKAKPLYDVFVHHNFAIHHFSIGLLPVRYKGSWHFYDAKGIRTLSLDSTYQDISLASQGFYIATIIDSTGKDAFVYIDSKGKELFQGRVFTKTSEFRKNIAFAESAGLWYILNSANNTCTLLENNALQGLYAVKRNTARFSHAKVNTSHGVEIFLIDTMGQIVYSATVCGGNERPNVVSIDDQLILCSSTYKAIFYDMQGKELLTLEEVEALEGLGEGLMLLRMRTGEKKLFDFKMNPVTLHAPPGVIYEYSNISKRILVTNAQDTITGEKFLGLFDSKSKVLTYRMGEDNFGGLIGDRIIYATFNGWGFDFIALVSMEGDILYAERNKDSIYNLAISRYFPKTDIKGLLVINDENIESLPAYTHVENLEFQFCQFEELPECICRFQQLKSITVNNCTRLKRLPDCLGRLPYFDDLLIKDCTNLSTLEEFLMHYPRTLVINTHGHYFSEGFNKVIEEKLPHIKLSSWTDNWFYDDTD